MENMGFLSIYFSKNIVYLEYAYVCNSDLDGNPTWFDPSRGSNPATKFKSTMDWSRASNGL